jgi:hypothetical protein
MGFAESRDYEQTAKAINSCWAPQAQEQRQEQIMAEFQLVRVARKSSPPRLENVSAEVARELKASGIVIPPGTRIAIAVGSRGIQNLCAIVGETVRWVASQGGIPFIIPAMGSHGGATATGQRQILESYGITREGVGAPVVSSMEVVELPRGNLKVPVYFDREAFSAAGTIVINRVKPHTDYHGPHESGLAKMIAIGLGKEHQARIIHSHGVRGLRDLMPEVARQSLRHNNVLLGLAIVENRNDETLLIKALPAPELLAKDRELLEIARSSMPRLPVAELDTLIVDEIGKNISGLGLDPNVIGRLKISGEAEPESPRIKMIIIRSLSKESHGNACGMGLADIMTRRLFDQVDFGSTYSNIVTSGFFERGKMPLLAETDEQAMRWADRGSGVHDAGAARIIRIRDTLHLEEMQVSPAVLDEISGTGDFEVREEVTPLFDEDGGLAQW